MNTGSSPVGAVRSFPAILLIATLFFAADRAVADQIEMQNGDRYVGRVLSMSTNEITMQNEVLGVVKIPRAKIARLVVGNAVASTNSPASASPSTANSSSNVVEQIQQQFLADASPEARAKFNELASGLLSGKISVNDIRAQAKSAADQLRSLKADLGSEAGEAVDGYLAILDNFLNETKSSSATTTNAPSKPSQEVLPLQRDD